MKKKHLILPVLAIFLSSFIIWNLSSFSIHKNMLINTVSVTSQIACGQTAQKIIFGLSYGKEINNYLGMDSLINESIDLFPRLKNLYVCDTNGLICGSYVKMLNNTQAISKKIAIDKETLVDINIHQNELHTARPLDVNGKTEGYIVAVIDMKTLTRPLFNIMLREALISFICCLLSALICFLILKLLLKHIKNIKIKKFIKIFTLVLTIFAFMFSSCIIHLNTQKIILNSEIVRQGEVMAKTINVDINKIFKKGIKIEQVTGLDNYLKERLYGLTALSSITIEDKITKEQIVAHNEKEVKTLYTNEYRGLSFFDILIGVSEKEYSKYKNKSIVTWVMLLLVFEGLSMAVLYIITHNKKKQKNK